MGWWKRNLNRIPKFLNLDWKKKKLFIKLWFLLAISRIILTFVPFKYWKSKLAKETGIIDKSDKYEIQEIVDFSEKASRFIPKATCLVRALAIHHMLHKNGYPSEIKIGVKKSENDQFDAHAWVCYNGIIIIGNLEDLPKYQELPIERLNKI